MAKVVDFLRKMKKVGSDDPRRVIHSFKVGLALMLVSALYYINPIFDGLGESAMWAVLTVVLCMEFTVGAAILKGLNRACATFLAGALGVGAHHLATLLGPKWEAAALGLMVFVVAAAATFARFVPELKSRYDYGVMIFILTFCLVTVSSYRKDKIVVLAKDRLLAIAAGVFISFFTSILVFPVWAGDDLHNLAAVNIEKLACFLQGFGEAVEGKKPLSSQSHRGLLNSKPAEDASSNLARWEPPHGRFGFRHPWDQYAKIGDQSRRCAYLMEALAACLASNHQAEFDKQRAVACLELSVVSGKALREAALSVRSMTAPPAVIKHHLATAEQLAASLMENCVDAKDILVVATVASILMGIVGCCREIGASVEELARLARFRRLEDVSTAVVVPVADVDGSDHVAIEVQD